MKAKRAWLLQAQGVESAGEWTVENLSVCPSCGEKAETDKSIRKAKAYGLSDIVVASSVKQRAYAFMFRSKYVARHKKEMDMAKKSFRILTATFPTMQSRTLM